MRKVDISRSLWNLAMLPVIALLCACAAPAQVAPPAVTPENMVVQYRLGAGDQVRITVFNQPSLSGEFTLDGAGLIALPLVGVINCANKTAGEIAQSIADALTKAGYLVNPNVSVQISQFRPYYILGEVAAPGAYPYIANLTVRKAVATARGYSVRANVKRVYIQRAGDREERLYEVTPTTAVLPGDTVRIPERRF